MGLLSIAIWLPIAVGVVLLALGRDQHANTVRWIALIGSIASFVVTIPLATRFDRSTAAMQFVENLAWIDRFKPRRAVITNMHSDLDYEVLRQSLPAGVIPAFDGMRLTLERAG